MKANGSRREEREEKISRKNQVRPPVGAERKTVGRRVGRGGGVGWGWRSMRGGPCARWLAWGAWGLSARAHSAAPLLSRRRRPRRAFSSRVRLDFTCPKCSSQCSRSQPRECSCSRSPSRTRTSRRSGLVAERLRVCDLLLPCDRLRVAKSLFRERKVCRVKCAPQMHFAGPRVAAVGREAPSCRSPFAFDPR
ncbi:unnamed protein product, partial [Brenthis ino]